MEIAKAAVYHQSFGFLLTEERMKSASLTVRGEDAWALPKSIADVESEDRFRYDGNWFAVITIEQYFYRILSSVQTTVVFDLVDETTMEVRVIAGGGAAGLARDDADAEGTALRKLVERLRRFAARMDLDIERR